MVEMDRCRSTGLCSSIDEHMAFYERKLALIEKAWAEGHLLAKEYDEVRAPVSVLRSVVVKAGPGSEGKESVSKKVKGRISAKEKPVAVAKMEDGKFNDNLKGFLCDGTLCELSLHPEMPTNNLDDMAKFLKTQKKEISERENSLLIKHLKFGEHLIEARLVFMAKKKNDKLPDTWEDWIQRNAEISLSYAKRHIQMTKLVKEYPKLNKLALSFKELFVLRNKIKQVFEKNESMRREWRQAFFK